jgi:pilus assembly protein Flp/PilA
MRTRIRRVQAGAYDRGASAVEYGLMVAAIAAVIVAIVFGLGGVVAGVFTGTCQHLGNATQQGTTECGGK